MINLYRARRDVPGNPLLVDSVHDELVIECDEEHVEAVEKWLLEIMIYSMREALADPEAPVRVKTETAYDYSAVKELEEEAEG
jgi:DNA polymerase I-like protein with 3'-5' exonuclease and polymerase domains